MTHVFHRAPRSVPARAERGRGCWIYDSAGRAYLDGSGGAAVSCLGHDDREVIEAIKAQLDRIPFAHTGFFTTSAMEELADHLSAHAPEGLNRVYFVSGGSEAVEAALDHGLIVYPMGGTIDGELGDHALIAPPFIIDDELDQLVARLGAAIDAATAA